MPHRIVKSRLFWIACAAWLAFFPAQWLIQPRELFEILNGLIVAVSVGIIFGFARSALDIMPRQPGEMRGGDALILGTITVFAGLAVVFCNLWAWRVLGGPATDNAGIINHWTGGLGRWVLVTGGSLLLTASSAVEGGIPRAAYMRTGAWIAAGIGLAGTAATIGFR